MYICILIIKYIFFILKNKNINVCYFKYKIIKLQKKRSKNSGNFTVKIFLNFFKNIKIKVDLKNSLSFFHEFFCSFIKVYIYI